MLKNHDLAQSVTGTSPQHAGDSCKRAWFNRARAFKGRDCDQQRCSESRSVCAYSRNICGSRFAGNISRSYSVVVQCRRTSKSLIRTTRARNIWAPNGSTKTKSDSSPSARTAPAMFCRHSNFFPRSTERIHCGGFFTGRHRTNSQKASTKAHGRVIWRRSICRRYLLAPASIHLARYLVPKFNPSPAKALPQPRILVLGFPNPLISLGQASTFLIHYCRKVEK